MEDAFPPPAAPIRSHSSFEDPPCSGVSTHTKSLISSQTLGEALLVVL